MANIPSPEEVVSFDAFEHAKENIEPITRGRSAAALFKVFSDVTTTPQVARNEHEIIRNGFEQELETADDLDDPLDVWIRYIKWVQDTYPQGQSAESGIVTLLERCTSKFQRDTQYQSDPRYLRVWLQYSKYSDTPLELFSFLRHNDIGQRLATFYEEYAALMEKLGRKHKADEIFQIGLLAEARPLDRLRRRYNEFLERLQRYPPSLDEPTSPPPPLRPVLGRSHQQAGRIMLAAIDGTSAENRGSSRVQVYADTEEDKFIPVGTGGWESIGTLKSRKKENTMEPRPWVGEKMPMIAQTTRPSDGQRLVVFRDEVSGFPPSMLSQSAPTKKPEHVAVNVEAVYSIKGNEFSFEELLAKRRGLDTLTWDMTEEIEKGDRGMHVNRTNEMDKFDMFQRNYSEPLELKQLQCLRNDREKRISPSNKEGIYCKSSKMPPLVPIPCGQIHNEDDDEENRTDDFKMPLRDNDSSLKKKASPTINTAAALADIFDLFSQPLKADQDGEQDSSDSEDDQINTSSITTRTAGEEEAFEDTSSEKDVDNDENDEDHLNTRGKEEFDLHRDIEAKTTTKIDDELSSVIPSDSQSRLQIFATPEQEWAIPPPQPTNQEQAFQGPERREMKFMTPIEERTESTIFSSSCYDLPPIISESPLTERPLFKAPRTPPGIFNSGESSQSSPFEGNIDIKPKYSPIPNSPISTIKEQEILTVKSKLQPLSKKPIIKEPIVNPMQLSIRNVVFKELETGLNTYQGYHLYQDKYAKVDSIEKYIQRNSRKSGDATHPINMCVQFENRNYLIRRKLGQGAFAPVYLATSKASEAAKEELRAIKVERDPPNAWEFYIMKQVKQRLGISPAASSIIEAFELYQYQDESYLMLEYRDQGTILDLVNRSKGNGENSTGVVDEVLAMFIAVDLLRAVEGLHSNGILHGDMKPDNCLLRFDPVEDSQWSSAYRADGSGGWSKKGIALIDFGRGIDMQLFVPTVQFIADWKMDEQDCPEMRDARPWTYQVDYWGLAGILHSMLFGKYIQTKNEPMLGMGMGRKRYKLVNSLKRYWQIDLWNALFEVLLNSVAVQGGLPITGELKKCRQGMEQWLECNAEKGVGLKAIIRRIESERRLMLR